MSTNISKASLVNFTFLLILFTFACDKEDEGSAAAKAGQWSGTGISFTVSGDPQKVSDLEFTYSGHATGTSCSFDYESGASFATVASITDNKFEAELNTFVVSGTFLTDSIAQVQISWEAYDSNCDANYTGSMTYTARYDSAR